jgi:hypothetical protein
LDFDFDGHTPDLISRVNAYDGLAVLAEGLLKKLTIKRLGSGDPYTRRGFNTTARWLFLEAVRLHVPAAFASLAQLAPSLPDVISHRQQPTPDEAPLQTWAAQWGFTGVPEPGRVDWLFIVARDTAKKIRKFADWEEWVLTTLVPQPNLQPGLGRVRQRAAVRDQGFVPTPYSRAADQQFHRLALFQVKRLTPRQINALEERPVEDKEIRKAIVAAAALAGIVLRKAKAGRPKQATLETKTSLAALNQRLATTH